MKTYTVSTCLDTHHPRRARSTLQLYCYFFSVSTREGRWLGDFSFLLVSWSRDAFLD